MWRACRKSRLGKDWNTLEFNVMNCLNGCKEKINMHQFFKGCGESFQKPLPRHFSELIRCLPFIHNTHSHAGFLNIAAKVPEMLLKSDMGPKTCFSYGVDEELGFGSVTNLQYAVSDRVQFLFIYICAFIYFNV